MTDKNIGISNRETAEDEARGRQEHPPLSPDSPPPPQDAAGSTDETAAEDDGLQTSHKAGSRSVAQKADEARYPDGSMPAARKVAGAFGREPSEPDSGS